MGGVSKDLVRYDESKGAFAKSGLAGMDKRKMVKKSTVADGLPESLSAQALRTFDKSLPMTLLRAHESVLRTFIPHLRAHDLSTQQWRVMRALAEVEAYDVSELAEACSLLRPSVSRIVQNLEGRGILLRQPCGRDSRRSLVSITQEGRDLIDLIAPESEARYAYIEKQFGRDNLAALYDMLQALVTSLSDPIPAFGDLAGEDEAQD